MNEQTLIFDFALVMLLLLVAPLVSTRLRLPDIVGIILAGVVVGEHGLGIFTLDITFQLLGAVGLLYLMFLAGLEINLNEFHRYRKPSLVFGLLTFCVPQAVGTLGARWLLDFTWPQAILLASMFASHTLIPFSITQRLGISKGRAVTATIGATIITDTLALLVLAVIVKEGVHGAVGAGDPVAFWTGLSLSLALLLVASLVLLPRLGYWFLSRVAPDGASEFIFCLAAVFLTSYAAESAGVEAILGAFLAGLALSSLVPERGVLTSRLHFVGNALFIPFFLLSVGMRVDLRVFVSSLDGWTIASFMVITVMATKWLAARLAGVVLGYGRDEAGLMFGLSVNQAAATLAAVLVGVEVGIFDAAVLNGTIMMILVTCLVGPWVTEACGRHVAEGEAAHPVREHRDAGRILVPVSRSSLVAPVVDLAIALRPERCVEPLFPLNVVLDGSDVDVRIAGSERLLGTAVGRAVAAGVDVVPLTRIDLNVAGGILRATREFHVSTVVIGWHARRLQQPFSQSLPDLVVREAPASVVVFRPGEPLNTMRRLLVALPPLIERNPGVLDTLALLRRLAAQSGAGLQFFSTEGTASLLGGSDANSWSTRGAWDEVMRAVGEARRLYDGLVLVSDRKGCLAWQPSLERLPVQWAARWAEANVLVVYPARVEEREDEVMPSEEASSPRSAAGLGAVATTVVQSRDLQGAVTELLAGALGAEPEVRSRMVSSVLATGPVPLSPSIALLHAHVPDLAEARVLVGTNGEGFDVAGFAARPTTVVLLLSPAGAPPEEHLKRLAAIARSAVGGTLWKEGA